jgi:mannose-6-phosphate isomerase-like protein (cupin superfamily)
MKFRYLLPLALALASGGAIAQVAPGSLLEPESYLQDTPNKRRAEAMTPRDTQAGEPLSNMATGVVIDRYIGEASRAPSRRWHNTMFVQNILHQGDPDPAKQGNPGAVLTVNKSLDLVTLPGRNITPLEPWADQVIAYVTGGQGRLDDGNQYWDLKEGVAFIIPPGQAHRLTNAGESTLRMLVYTQVMPQQGITPRQGILVRDTNLMAMSEENVHWSNMSKFVFQGSDGMAGRILLVYMGPQTIAGPHGHVPGTEEIWTKVSNGPSIMQIGSEIRQWRPNMAMKAPPNGHTVHAAINTSNSIQYWFYFAQFPPPPAQAAGRGGNAGRGGAGGRGALGAQPPSFPQQALTRATVAGRPLSSLPADAYKW